MNIEKIIDLKETLCQYKPNRGLLEALTELQEDVRRIILQDSEGFFKYLLERYLNTFLKEDLHIGCCSVEINMESGNFSYHTALILGLLISRSKYQFIRGAGDADYIVSNDGNVVSEIIAGHGDDIIVKVYRVEERVKEADEIINFIINLYQDFKKRKS